MEDQSEQTQLRRAKLDELREKGINPYISRFSVTAKSSDLIDKYGELSLEEFEKETTFHTIAGRILTRRGHGKTTFMHIQDSSGKIQLYIRKDDIGEDSYGTVKKLDIGDIIGVKGHLFKTRTGELTLHADELTLLSKSLRPLPEKWQSTIDFSLPWRRCLFC